MKEKLAEIAGENKTILCLGIDPDIGRMKCQANGIETYFEEITDKLLEEKQIAAIKPNYAFFAQYGFEGLHALRNLMERYRDRIPIVLDAKRGDIGKTAEAYAREVYDFWGADAVTINPYMGQDSILPFVKKGKLPYVLCRTSNSGATDFQELRYGGEYLYEKVAAKAAEWKCGLVVGATSKAIKRIIKTTGSNVPMLIPGIGFQGGDLDMVMKAVKGNPYIHRINASSSIAYAHEKGGNAADAALKEAEKLNAIIRKYIG